MWEQVSHLEGAIPIFHYHDTSKGKDPLFKEIQQIVADAKEEILALNWSSEESAFPGESSYARSAYFNELIAASRRVPYTRVIQAETWPPKYGRTIGSIFEPGYIAHFRAMLDEQSNRSNASRGHPIALTFAPPRVPSTFLIVDNKHLVWELLEMVKPPNSEEPKWRIRGLIIVHDPSRQFIPNFRNTFDLARVGERAVTAADLAEQMFT
jgi:hypothetical protein